MGLVGNSVIRKFKRQYLKKQEQGKLEVSENDDIIYYGSA